MPLLELIKRGLVLLGISYSLSGDCLQMPGMHATVLWTPFIK